MMLVGQKTRFDDMKGGCIMEYPKLFTPIINQVYKNRNGLEYLCTGANGEWASMRAVKSGWHMSVNCCRMYTDGTIEWDYSYNGRFVN